MGGRLREGWFSQLFGFPEAIALREKGGEGVRARIELRADGTLTSRVNGFTLGAGVFSTPSLGQLREQAGAARRGPLTLRHLATRDVFEMHSRPELAGATFMAASQFNALEFPSPNVTPDDGVSGYSADPTQGPACALAAPGATVLRNYFVPMEDGSTGQTAERQLNLLADVLLAVQGCAGDEPADDKLPLVEVRNGYTNSDEARLRSFNAALCSAAAPAPDDLLSLLRIGLHVDVEVPWGPERFVLRPQAEWQRVNQVFCSALACGYSDGSLEAWEPLARLVLRGAYEATLLAAALYGGRRADTDADPPVVLLTFLGGGVFCNPDEWIEQALAESLAAVEARGIALDVVVTHFGAVDEVKAARIGKEVLFARAALRRAQQVDEE